MLWRAAARSGLLAQFPARLVWRGGLQPALSPLQASVGAWSAPVHSQPCQTWQQSRAVAVAASGGGSGASRAAPIPASSTPGAQAFQAWRSQWWTFLSQLHEQGHYSADPGVGPTDLASDAGAMKRAVLKLGRERRDILFALQPGKLRALVEAGFPLEDRKTRNAHKRLQASIVEGTHLPSNDGGPADFQDVLRVFLSLAGCDVRDASLFQPLMKAAMDLLPDIQQAAAAEPSPEALAAAAAPGATGERFMPGKEAREPRQPGSSGGGTRRKEGPAQQQGQAQEKGTDETLEQWISQLGRSEGGRSSSGGRAGGRSSSSGGGGGRSGPRGPRGPGGSSSGGRGSQGWSRPAGGSRPGGGGRPAGGGSQGRKASPGPRRGE